MHSSRTSNTRALWPQHSALSTHHSALSATALSATALSATALSELTCVLYHRCIMRARVGEGGGHARSLLPCSPTPRHTCSLLSACMLPSNDVPRTPDMAALSACLQSSNVTSMLSLPLATHMTGWIAFSRSAQSRDRPLPPCTPLHLIH